MSRHQLVKNLNVDDELDDFDGEYDEEYNQEQLLVGTVKVREILGGVTHISDQQIQDSLWHYYYDIPKTVDYLLRNFSGDNVDEGARKTVKGSRDAGLETCSSSRAFDIENFFSDMPWFNAPLERQAVLLPPLYPRGGLLGGSSSGEKAPKMSKLHALAAARKKKTQEQKSNSSEIDKPMADLSLEADISQASAPKQPSRGFPLRKRKDENEHEKAPPPLIEPEESGPVEPAEVTIKEDVAEQAAPSAFASTMFSSSSSRQPPDQRFAYPYLTFDANPFSGPSPDDVVKSAQSKATNMVGKKGAPKTNGEKKATQIANAVEALKLDDTPRASKNIDVLDAFDKRADKKNEANFVVIGHVDAGKSTLMGRLLYDLKVIDQRTIDRYRKEAESQGKASFALAWVLDQGTEERARGVTIDIATNQFSTQKTNFTILDAPGHRDFIPNMIAGASQADFAVLVVDASTGSFESGLRGQTKEHALLVKSMGVSRMIVAVNKLDTVNWSQERFTEIEQQIGAFLTTAGFKAANLSFIPCSGLNGENIARRSEGAAFSWYLGPTFLEELDNSEPIGRALTNPLRITIGDVFRGGAQNPLSISGRIEAGSLQVGDALLAQPAGKKCFIRGLEINSESKDWAVAGQNVTIHLSGIDTAHLKIGDVLCTPKEPIQLVKQFTVKALAFEFVMPMAVEVHRGRLHVAGKVDNILGVLDKKGKAKKTKVVKPGEVARLVVTLDGDVPLEAPARVVLRCDGVTVAAGLLE